MACDFVKQLPLANDCRCDKMVTSFFHASSLLAYLPTYSGLRNVLCLQSQMLIDGLLPRFQVVYGAFYILSQTLSCSGPPLGVFCTPGVYS